jgi:hypothetical protein
MANSERPDAEALGTDGTLELYPERVLIRRKGFESLFTQGLRGEKVIALERISSVQFKNAGTLAVDISSSRWSVVVQERTIFSRR